MVYSVKKITATRFSIVVNQEPDLLYKLVNRIGNLGFKNRSISYQRTSLIDQIGADYFLLL